MLQLIKKMQRKLYAESKIAFSLLEQKCKKRVLIFEQIVGSVEFSHFSFVQD